MKAVALSSLLLAGCVNFPNTHMPQGERKPFDGPKPQDLPNAIDVNKTSNKAYAQLNAPAGAATKLRVTCDGPAKVKAFVNARTVGESACPLELSIPAGTVQPDTATVVELETESSVLFRRISIE